MDQNLDARTITTILSTNYTGSHFLSLMLGSHSQCLHVGEIRHRRREHASDEGRRWCNICADPEQCPLYRNVTPENIGQAYNRIFQNFMDDGKPVQFLIDASKKVSWARRFLTASPYRLKYIHLIRDPRALVRRWRVSYETEHAKNRERWRGFVKNPSRVWCWLRGSENQVFTAKWLYQNRQITNFLKRHRLDSLIVTYHDLAKQPEIELKRICDWLSIAFEPAQIEYWNFEHHGTQKKQYEWIKQEKTSYFDTRWRDFLTPAEQEEIQTDKEIRKYLEQLNLTLNEDGLTRNSAADAVKQGETNKEQIPVAASSCLSSLAK
jgi:hypothetical protein